MLPSLRLSDGIARILKIAKFQTFSIDALGYQRLRLHHRAEVGSQFGAHPSKSICAKIYETCPTTFGFCCGHEPGATRGNETFPPTNFIME